MIPLISRGDVKGCGRRLVASAGSVRDVQIEDSVFEENQTALFFAGATDAHATRCKIARNRKTGVLLIDTKGSTLSELDVRESGYAGIRVSRSTNVRSRISYPLSLHAGSTSPRASRFLRG